MIDYFFGIVIEIEALSSTKDDIPVLSEAFLAEAKTSLKIEHDIDMSGMSFDISENCHSLKRNVYKKLLAQTLNETALTATMSDFFYDGIEVEDNYAHFLNIFDTAIINANHKKYKSQLMMSYKMGINRNTLRKKINELGLKLDEK